ncbi:hypothetical protein KRR26_10110 [Corallococcus sp. M34]|uniref:hypothetical protein n=1 Tax=Citreicoccus inhibens TaxID=2849499 RepID=UPI001C24176C|nr:hypothetical protein [Citreicoccus inhibens]MBU8895960.1 hypothetical protein [Citreicoccus inhibens]
MSHPLDAWTARLGGADPREVSRALEAMGTALESEDARARERAAGILLETLPRARATSRAAILALLQSSWWPPQVSLAEQAFGAVVAALSRADADSPEVVDAAMVLAHVCRVVPEQIPSLEAALAHASPAVRRAAASAVGRVGVPALTLLPALLPRLDEEGEVGDTALEAFVSLAPSAPNSTASVMLALIQRTEGARRYLALASLRGLLEELHRQRLPLPVLPDLEAALLQVWDDAEPTAGVEALVMLGLAASPSPRAVSALMQALRADRAEVAATAACALLRSGWATEEAVGVLGAQLVSDVPDTQGAALTALESLDREALARARSVLASCANTASPLTRDALRALLSRAR